MKHYGVNDYLDGKVNKYWVTYRNKHSDDEYGQTYFVFCKNINEATNSLNLKNNPEREITSISHINIRDNKEIIDI